MQSRCETLRVRASTCESGGGGSARNSLDGSRTFHSKCSMGTADLRPGSLRGGLCLSPLWRQEEGENDDTWVSLALFRRCSISPTVGESNYC